MANLLEALNQTAPIGDTTSQLSTLLRAKSGKAVGGPTTALSAQQERAAQAETAKAMQPVVTAAETQAIGQEQQAQQVEQTAEIQQQEIGQARRAEKVRSQLRIDQILSDLAQGKGKEDLAKYQANLEQVGQTLRLNTTKYTDNLKREGDRARLMDETQFSEQLAKTIFGDKKALLEKQLGNRSILKANDREFEIQLAQIDIDSAWALLNAEIKGETEKARWSSVGGLANVGLERYGNYVADQDKKAYYTTGAGKYETTYEAYKYGSPAARGKV